MNDELLKLLAPVPQKRPLLPELSPQAELALLCRVLFRDGYNDHIAGHISYLQDDETILINPWELAWDELTAGDILRLDKTGKVIEGGWNVTPAVNLHTEIHARRPDVNVIIHNHSRYGTLWANAGRVPPIYDQTSAQVNGELKLVDEYNAAVNDTSEGARCAELLGDAKWALLANHGVLVVADSIAQAHLRAVTLERRARTAYEVEALGGGKPMVESVADSVGEMIDGNGFPFLWEAMARRELRSDATILDC
ncbi:class II aldolase/adducin family protein [Litorivivens sp.]|uniref:class II aldolase/adducin family protein n=1 Tax=Litorivivens sp. TaxID=2020868 RepID=UPI0035683F1F